MLKGYSNTVATFLREWNKRVMLHFHITLIRLKELHLRWSTSSVPPKNSVQVGIQLGIC
jgi:hypothetical protein